MHMKRFLTLALSALLAAGLLTACGGTSDGSADTAEVSLSSFYAGLAEEYGWTAVSYTHLTLPTKRIV